MEPTFSDNLKKELLSVIRSDRLSHTVIISSDDEEEREYAALFLSMYAVCKEQERPCMRCSACKKALSSAHPDIFAPELSGKLRQVNMDSAREIVRQANIIPNEADRRVFLFFDADRTLPVITQNALLKLIEEPPQDILFIFTVKKPSALLSTVRSRAQLITLSGKEKEDEAARELAEKIIDGIVSLYETDLLLPLNALSSKENKERFVPAIHLVEEYLRTALSFSCGIMTDDEYALKLSRKLSREEILRMIEISEEAINKSQTNLNMSLLATWLCSQYRRTLWQK